MLSKLMKYELKATGRVFLPLYIALLAFALINHFMLAVPTPWQSPTVISMAIYVLIMVGMFIMTLIMTIQRFNKNLLSEEGYLMFTLPVKPWQHIVSKMIVSMLWVVLSAAVALTSIIIIGYQSGYWALFISDLGEFFKILFDYLGISFVVFSLEFIIGTFLSLASGILLLYASITIGHLFSRRRILASFAAFIVLNTLTEIFTLTVITIAGGFDSFNLSITPDTSQAMLLEIHFVFWASIVLIGIIGAAYFAISNRILSRHLNLE